MTIAHNSYVRYQQREENIGRAAIRNLLARDAIFPYLLFLDGDSFIPSDDFLSVYLENIDSCVNGGRVYHQEKPELTYLLHWTYGNTREARRVHERQNEPVLYFHSNNFMIHRDILLDHPFPEEIDGYGYEDLAFAQHLATHDIQISHIHNPTIHDVLDPTSDFIQKTITASINLKSYYLTKKISRTPLITMYERLSTYRLRSFYTKIIGGLRPLIIRNLHSRRPSMLLINLLKLYHFILGR